MAHMIHAITAKQPLGDLVSLDINVDVVAIMEGRRSPYAPAQRSG